MQVQVIKQIVLIATGLASIIALLIGFNSIRTGRKSPYYRIRQKRIADGWRWIGTACIFSTLAALTVRFAEPLTALVYPPTPTITATASFTPLPSQTPEPSQTETLEPTPSASHT